MYCRNILRCNCLSLTGTMMATFCMGSHQGTKVPPCIIFGLLCMIVFIGEAFKLTLISSRHAAIISLFDYLVNENPLKKKTLRK